MCLTNNYNIKWYTNNEINLFTYFRKRNFIIICVAYEFIKDENLFDNCFKCNNMSQYFFHYFRAKTQRRSKKQSIFCPAKMCIPSQSDNLSLTLCDALITRRYTSIKKKVTQMLSPSSFSAMHFHCNNNVTQHVKQWLI